MTLDLAPGTIITIDGQQYTVEEHSAFHDVDFRLDLVRISGATPAHERWLVAVLPEPYIMLMQRLEQEWLTPPVVSIIHEGETYNRIYQGGGYRLRWTRTGKSKDGRVEYALFRANSGRVILTVMRNDEFDVWIGRTLPLEAVHLPGATA
ncbi:MAG TPA: DUF4178 domain-containing protein [Armatimonadota bacterium]|nr:DUF4178 domain-containing protein [Armatimonadota bacterium]